MADVASINVSFSAGKVLDHVPRSIALPFSMVAPAMPAHMGVRLLNVWTFGRFLWVTSLRRRWRIASDGLDSNSSWGFAGGAIVG